MRSLMIAAAVAALTCSISSASYAQTSQQALMKSCNSDAAAKRLKGDARKSFMSDCLAGKTQTSQTPSTQPMSTAAQTPQATQQQRMKDCNANATSQKLKGNARKDFMSSCLSGGAASAPASAPASATATVPPVAPTTTAKPEAPAATRTIAAPGAPVQPKQPTTSGSAPATAALGPGQYATEAQAKSTCGTDTVVWVNLDSHIYHFKNAADYGKTKKGAFMCEREAVTGGSRAAKNEKRS